MTTTLRVPQRQQRDAIALAHLHLADSIAAAFTRRFSPLVEHDDLIQIAREALLLSASRCDSSRNPAPYLRRCIHGALLHHLRDGVRLVRISRRAHEQGRWPLSHLSLHHPVTDGHCPLDLLPAPLSNPAARCPQDSEQRTPAIPAIELLLDRLPAVQAAAIRLTLLDGLSLQAAAQRLGQSRSSVHRHRHRALRSLRQQLTAA